MADSNSLAVYIHWPYCTRICPYCDFNVYKAKGEDNALVAAITNDLAWWRAQSGERVITSIHFGGGTPSLLKASEISQLIETVDTLWGLPKETEIALEANPNDADAVKWQAYRAAGITRLSLGVQTFNNAALDMLGRDHDAAQAKTAINNAVNIFPSVSADLIFGCSGQTQADLSTDLEILLGSGVQHISTYQLTIEPGTAFAKAESRGQKRTVDEEHSADFFEFIISQLSQAEFDHYEVSNFAKAGHQSQHNLAYWRGYDYVGVGPGAHGRLTKGGMKSATICALTPSAYIENVANTQNGIEIKDVLSEEERAEEYILMGLRIQEGFSLKQFEALMRQPLSPSKIEPLIEMQLLRREGDRIIATPKGRMVLNAVIDALLV